MGEHYRIMPDKTKTLIGKILGENPLRVWASVEPIAQEMQQGM